MKYYGETYVTYQTARQLEKVGFDYDCREYYNETRRRYPFIPSGRAYKAPTLAQVISWLRERYRIELVVLPYRHPNKWKCFFVYLGQSMEGDDKYDMCDMKRLYNSYEDAVDFGIRLIVKDYVMKVQEELQKQSVTT